MDFEIKLTDFTPQILSALRENVAAANEAVGLAMEAHVVEGAPVGTPTSTAIESYHGGSLRKSITHKVIGDTVYVGTNIKSENGAPYAIYVELGTGIYADGGKGRQSPWVWRDKNGDYHYTKGMKPRHFLKNAVSRADHIQEYKQIYENQLKKG